MLADPTGAFTKVKLYLWYILNSIDFVALCKQHACLFPIRQLTCYLTVTKLCKCLGISDPRGIFFSFSYFLPFKKHINTS